MNFDDDLRDALQREPAPHDNIRGRNYFH